MCGALSYAISALAGGVALVLILFAVILAWAVFR